MMSKQLTTSPAWLHRLVRWAVVDPWLIWLAILAPLIALIPIIVLYDCEQRLRFTGMVFQLMGLITVVWGLRDDRRLFREPTAIQRLLSWVHAFPGRKSRVPLVKAIAAAPEAGLVPDAALPLPSATTLIEERIANLERASVQHRIALANVRQDLRLIRSNAKQALANERIVRAKAVNDVNVMLREAVAGDLSFDTIGTLYFSLGTIFGSMSIELAPVLFGDRCIGPLYHGHFF